MLAKRAYEIYLRGSGIRRIGGELKKSMNRVRIPAQCEHPFRSNVNT
jgi:hypothetical protein